jgi:[protein-PII] uridylyltransferase
MQRYYRAAKIISQMNVIVLQNIESQLFPISATPVTINERFQSLNSLLDICDDQVFQRTPSALLEAFTLLQQHAELNGMTARTLRGLFHGRNLINAAFRRDPANRATFLSLFQQPHGIVHEFRRMNQLSILGRYLPAFRRIVGQMQHDLFHVYTVDQHIMMVVRNMRRFTMPEFAHEYPLCSRLIANFQRHWLLYIAAFFHDIAKGRHGDHSKLGMNDAKRFCREHLLSKEDTALVVFLVEHHLTMSRIAQKEDLSDPDIIQAFANSVGDERKLTALYLLTVADIRGTSPKVWNAWKGKLLEDLYFRTLRALGGTKPDASAELAMRQEDSKRILALYAFDAQSVQRFWEKLDVAWFLRHDAQDIAWITRAFAMRDDRTEPLVRARLSPLGEGLQVVVYTPDQPDLLARICEFFDRHRFSVLDARVHTTKTGYALDTFHLTDSGQAHYRDMIVSMEQELAVHIGRLQRPDVEAVANLSDQAHR